MSAADASRSLRPVRSLPVAATFQALPGASVVVNGATAACDAARTTPSTEPAWDDGFLLAATCEGEFSEITRSYAGKGMVRYAW